MLIRIKPAEVLTINLNKLYENHICILRFHEMHERDPMLICMCSVIHADHRSCQNEVRTKM